MDKFLLQQQVLERLAEDLLQAEQAVRAAHETATHEENIAENKYDTLELLKFDTSDTKELEPAWIGSNEVTFIDQQGNSQMVPKMQFEQLRQACLGIFKSNKALVSGKVVFETTANGRALEHSIKFSTLVHILYRSFAGAPFPPTYQYLTKFEVDGEGYQRRVSISQVLRPGEVDRFSLKIGADKSSLHSFKVRLLTTVDKKLFHQELSCAALCRGSVQSELRRRRASCASDLVVWIEVLHWMS